VAERSEDTALDMGRRSVARTILKLVALLLTAFVALGAEPSSPSPAVPSMGAAVFRMVGSLAVVIALFFAAAWLFRNLHRFKAPGSNQRKLQVLEGKSLGPRQAVYVVAYEQQRLLIGSSAQGLTLLTHLPEGEAQPQSQSSERILPVSFGEALMQALGRK
jgi:flagellar protein FliO/FliZ